MLSLILAAMIGLTGITTTIIGTYQRIVAKKEVASSFDKMAHHLATDSVMEPKPMARQAVAVFTLSASRRLREEGFGIAASKLLADTMARAGHFRVVRKARIKEQLVAHSDRTGRAVDLDTAVRFGKLLGAQLVVLGRITEQPVTYRIRVSLVQTGTGRVISTADEVIPRNRFETRAKRYLTPTPPARTFGVYFMRNSRNNPNDVPTFQYDRSSLHFFYPTSPYMTTVRPTSFPTHFLGIGLRYFPHPQCMLDVSIAEEPGPKIVAQETRPYRITEFGPPWPERQDEIRNSGIFLFRANANWVRPLRYGLSGILGAGANWYQGADTRGPVHISEVVPSIRLGLEYRRRSRWALSLFMNYDILNATAKYRWSHWPADSTAVELSKWSVEPSLAIYF